MPQGYRPSREALAVLLSDHRNKGYIVRVRCYCRSVRHYQPDDMIALFGNIPVLHLERHLRRCAACGARDSLSVSFELPSAADRQKMRVHKLVEIKTKKIPIWKVE